MSGRPNPDPRRMTDARFDAELGRAARALVTEPMPAGILDPAAGPVGTFGARRAIPGFATVAGALVVLVLVTAVAFVPRLPGGPGPSPTPTPSPTPSPNPTSLFRPTLALRLDFQTLGYTCQDGRPLATTGPGPDGVAREAAVCLAPAALGPFVGAVIVGESAAGLVVEVHAKADFTDGDTPAARDSVASMLAKAAAISVVQRSGNAMGSWVHDNVATLEPNGRVSTTIEGLELTLSRTSDGGYVLLMGLPAAG